MDERLIILNNLVAHYGKQAWWSSDNYIEDWVSMILIQQTTQLNAERALENLKNYLTPRSLLDLPLENLQQLIRPAGFYKQKSQYIKNLMTWYCANGADRRNFSEMATEDLRKELLGIKGIGQETADVSLLYIFHRKVFIADTYAIRLFNRLGYGPYTTYRQMRVEFQPLTEESTLEQCQEWHACIDVHGKLIGKRVDIDESWLKKIYL